MYVSLHVLESTDFEVAWLGIEVQHVSLSLHPNNLFLGLSKKKKNKGHRFRHYNSRTWANPSSKACPNQRYLQSWDCERDFPFKPQICSPSRHHMLTCPMNRNHLLRFIYKLPHVGTQATNPLFHVSCLSYLPPAAVDSLFNGDLIHCSTIVIKGNFKSDATWCSWGENIWRELERENNVREKKKEKISGKVSDSISLLYIIIDGLWCLGTSGDAHHNWDLGDLLSEICLCRLRPCIYIYTLINWFLSGCLPWWLTNYMLTY